MGFYRVSFNDLAQKITHKVSTTADASLEQIFKMFWLKITASVNVLF